MVVVLLWAITTASDPTPLLGQRFLAAA